jgi:hypothetical protein
MITYLGSAAIAAWFGVLPVTLLKWRARYSGFPEADIVIMDARGGIPGWLPNREAEIRAWHAARVGQGCRTDLLRSKTA